MAVAYISAGLPPDRFWSLSPRLYMLEMKGASDMLDREHKDRAWLAYHSAYLPDAKKRPTLAQLIGGKPKSRIMPWQDQLAAWANYASYRKGIK